MSSTLQPIDLDGKIPNPKSDDIPSAGDIPERPDLPPDLPDIDSGNNKSLIDRSSPEYEFK